MSRERRMTNTNINDIIATNVYAAIRTSAQNCIANATPAPTTHLSTRNPADSLTR